MIDPTNLERRAILRDGAWIKEQWNNLRGVMHEISNNHLPFIFIFKRDAHIRATSTGADEVGEDGESDEQIKIDDNDEDD